MSSALGGFDSISDLSPPPVLCLRVLLGGIPCFSGATAAAAAFASRSVVPGGAGVTLSGEPSGAAGSDGDAEIWDSGRRRPFFFGVPALGDAKGS